MMHSFKKAIAALAFATAASMPVQGMATPMLIGTGTLNNSNDLTIIKDGATTYEFLDLSPTYGGSVSNAVAAYSADGFHWASGVEVSELFGAFNITYGITPYGEYYPTVDPSDTALLAAYLGYEPAQASALGWIDDGNNGNWHTYACISGCGRYDTFVTNISLYWPEHSTIATFLVRTAPAPEPNSIALLGIGLFGLTVWQKRKKH